MAAFAAARQLRSRSGWILRDVLRTQLGPLFGAAATKPSPSPSWRSYMWSSATNHSANSRLAFPPTRYRPLFPHLRCCSSLGAIFEYRLIMAAAFWIFWWVSVVSGLGTEIRFVPSIGDNLFDCSCFAVWGSGLDIARGFATRAGRVDIGARARQLQARRLWTIALSGTAVAGFVIVILNTFQENLMFYITPTQVCAK